MKKILTLLLFILPAACAVYAQNPYYDAVKLRALLKATSASAYGFDETKMAEINAILKNYTWNRATHAPFADDQAIQDNICPDGTSSNPFLCDYFPATAAGDPIPVGSAVSAIGAFNGANIFNGVAQFLVERAKAEVNEAFFIRLKDFLDDYPEFATLFPHTQVFLGNYNSWEYANLLNTLKEAFNQDINQLPADIVKLKDLSEYDCEANNNDQSEYCQECKTRIRKIKAFFTSNDGRLLLSACKVADGVITNKKIPEIINSITDPAFLLGFTVADTQVTANIHDALQLINILSLSIESNETGKNYISRADFDTAMGDEQTLNLYLGLVYQKVRIANDGAGLAFFVGGRSIPVTTLITKGHTTGLLTYVKNCFTQIKDVQTVYDQLKADKLAAKTDLSPDYTALTTAVSELLTALHNISVIDPQLNIPEEAEVFYTYIDKSLQITNNIFAKNYNAAVMGTLTMISEFLKKQPNADADITNFCTNFMKYASFAANVVEAKTPADVKAAVEAVALPVGSYTIKQRSAFNISVNAYVGYGWDNNKPIFKEAYAHGVYAPIGFSFNFGYSKSWGIPVSFFASVIDLGSFVSYNLQKTSTDEMKQEVRLESVFSPSAQFFLQVPKTPLTFGGGWRQTPKLFYSKSDNTFTPIASQSVFNLSILIDIPLFTLHNVPFATAKQ